MVLCLARTKVLCLAQTCRALGVRARVFLLQGSAILFQLCGAIFRAWALRIHSIRFVRLKTLA
jgi:hypothetical protein